MWNWHLTWLTYTDFACTQMLRTFFRHSKHNNNFYLPRNVFVRLLSTRCKEHGPLLSAWLVVLSVCPSVLLARSTVITTCSSLFTDDDFLQKSAGNTPGSKILHLKFQKFSGGDTPDPSCERGRPPPASAPSHGLCPRLFPMLGRRDLRVRHRLTWELTTLSLLRRSMKATAEARRWKL